MRIADIYKNKKTPFSFEIFPPKGEMDTNALKSMLDGISGTDPDFISVTCSAGGTGSSRNTAHLAGIIEREYGITSMAHITCINTSKDDLDEYIEEIKSEGIENALALRGDKIGNSKNGAFEFASELIGYLKKNTNFCIGAGCYPEGHIACDDIDTDIIHLKEKQDAGVDFLVSQLFFDNTCFYKFVEKARAKGVTLPIDAGVMPFMSKSQITRMIFMCGASLPAQVIRMLNRYENDPQSLMNAGMEYAYSQITDLVASGMADGIHIYTMNKPEVAKYEAKAVKNAGL